MRVRGEWGQRAPSEAPGVEKVGRGDRRVRGEDAKEMGNGFRMSAAEGKQGFGGEEEAPCLAGGFESSMVRIRDVGEDQNPDVVWEAGY